MHWLEHVRHEVLSALESGQTVERVAAEYQGDGTAEDVPYMPDLDDWIEAKIPFGGLA